MSRSAGGGARRGATEGAGAGDANGRGGTGGEAPRAGEAPQGGRRAGPGGGGARRVRNDVLRQSGLTGVAAALSIFSGLLLEVAIAKAFGAGRQTDAFFVAIRLPLGLTTVLMVAANQALVPAISTWFVRRGEEDTGRLVSVVLTATFVLLALFAAVIAVFAMPVVRVIAPGGSVDHRLAASMARMLLAIVPLVGATEVLRALLNARYSFVAPAAMSISMNGVAAAIVLAFARGDVHVLAWAYIAGTVAQLAFMSAMAARKRFRYRPSLTVRDPEIKAVARLCTRPLAGAAMNPLARTGETIFASFLPTGSIAILNYGMLLINAIGGTVFYRSVVVALVPRLTEATVRGDDAAVWRVTNLGLKIMVALSLPLIAFMVVLAKPAVVVAFRLGSFSRSDAELLGVVLAIYSASLIGSAVQRALLTPFYARLDTSTPLRNTWYGVAANLALLPLLVLPFGASRNGVFGVAAAYSVSQYVNVGHAWWQLRQTIGIRFFGIWQFAARLVPGSIASGIVMAAAAHVLRLGAHWPRWELLGRTMLAGVVGLVVFLAITAAMGGREIGAMLRSLRGRRRLDRAPAEAPARAVPDDPAAERAPGELPDVVILDRRAREPSS